MDYQTWVEQAKCRDADPNIFHPGRGGDSKPAISICNTCPVIEPCREYAIVNDTSGIWGGLSGRQIMRERHRRGIKLWNQEFEDFPNGIEKSV